MKNVKLRYLARFLLTTLFVTLLGVQAAVASPENGTIYYGSSGGGSTIGPVLFIAIGTAALVSSIDCAADQPSLKMCKPGGSSYRGSMTRAQWGSMGSLISY